MGHLKRHSAFHVPVKYGSLQIPTTVTDEFSVPQISQRRAMIRKHKEIQTRY
jgi:hypothetical protein